MALIWARNDFCPLSSGVENEVPRVRKGPDGVDLCQGGASERTQLGFGGRISWRSGSCNLYVMDKGHKAGASVASQPCGDELWWTSGAVGQGGDRLGLHAAADWQGGVAEPRPQEVGLALAARVALAACRLVKIYMHARLGAGKRSARDLAGAQPRHSGGRVFP